MVGWHYRLNGREFEQIQGDNEGQGSLACCHMLGSQRVRHDLALNNNNSQDAARSYGCDHQLGLYS